jgi:hypothetical protein
METICMPKVVNQDDPVHWSKDFVEHLRTVHFTLIAIAVGLSVLVLSSKQYNAINALVQIEEILDLKRQWSPAWMEQFGDTEKQSAELRNLDHFLDTNSSVSWGDPGFEGVIYGMKRRYPLSPNEIAVKCKFPKENWYQSGFDWSPTKFPETLTDFKAWWGSLGQSYVIYLPNSIADSGVVENLRESLKSDTEVSVADFRSTIEERTPQLELQLSLDPKELSDSTDEDGKQQSFSYVAQMGDDRELMLKVSILTLKRYAVTRGTISHHFHNLHTGEFQDTFADLARASDAMSDLPLQDIKEFIHDEASKGPEIFEVFGMKFPAGQVTLWGIILLLSIELYFFTYLRQLAGKLGPDDPGWDVPWIGMDGSTLAQAILFVTLVPLPVAALTLLAVRRATSLFVISSNKSASVFTLLRSLNWAGRGEVAVLLLACVASLILAILCWKYRPQLIEASHGLVNASKASYGQPSSEDVGQSSPGQ